jgi:hypothetical protein
MNIVIGTSIGLAAMSYEVVSSVVFAISPADRFSLALSVIHLTSTDFY